MPVTDPDRPARLPDGQPRGGARRRPPPLRRRPPVGPRPGWTWRSSRAAALAVVGASGAGKSSLVNVLLRFWPLASGTATLGGVALDALAQDDVRRAVALVDQDARLFAGTIGQNVTLGPARGAGGRGRPGAAAGPARLVGGHPARGSRHPGGRGRAPGSRAASVSGSPWPGPSWPGGRCWCSTSRRLGWTRSPPGACWPTYWRRAAGGRCCWSPTALAEARTLDKMVVLDHGRVVDPEPAPPG